MTLVDLRHGGYFEVNFRSNVHGAVENRLRVLQDAPENEEKSSKQVSPELIDWNVTDSTAENMKIKLDISEKLYVSTGESLDMLYFNFLNNSIFVTESDIKMANMPKMEINVQR